MPRGDLVVAAVFAALLAPLAYRTAAAWHGAGDLVALLAAIAIGFLATDLTSGVVHWFCDTFFGEDTPVIGAALIHPFREHHRDPLAMTERSFLRVSRSNLLAMSFGLGVMWTCARAPASFLRDACVLSYSCAVILTNQLHLWAHASRVPRLVAWCQQAHLVISPAWHARHHDRNGTVAFCITTGWLNPLLDALGIFARLEHALARMRGRRRDRRPDLAEGV